MFGKMMNRYYYGKSGKGDYTNEDLPQTRWQLFWEMLRVRLSGLIRLNLMYAVAWLPAIFVIGRGLLLWYAGLAIVADAHLQLESGEITAEAEIRAIEDLFAAADSAMAPAQGAEGDGAAIIEFPQAEGAPGSGEEDSPEPGSSRGPRGGARTRLSLDDGGGTIAPLA